MKNKLLIHLIFCAFFSAALAQESSDTTLTTIYQVSGANRLSTVEVGGNTTFAFYYRDLKHIGEIRSIQFKKPEEVSRFIELCYKALEEDKTTISQVYNVSRNRVSKRVVRINDKREGYFLLTEKDLRLMENAFNGFIEAK